MDLNESVRALLDKQEAAGKPIPSLRMIRAEIGRGSLTTISDAVKAWKMERLQRVNPLPQGFDEAASAALSKSVWQLIVPIMNQLYEQVQQSANERIEAEAKDAQQLRTAAAEMLAEVSAKDGEMTRLRSEVEALRLKIALNEEALKRAQEALNAKTEEFEKLTVQLRAALDRASAAEASCDMMRKLIPLLDAQHVRKPDVRT